VVRQTNDKCCVSPQNELLPHLRFQERLLWAGRPDPSVRFAPSDAYLVPFSVIWAGFFVVAQVGALFSSGGLFSDVFGLPFLAVGAYIVFGRFIYKSRRKRRTVYGVTDQRAIVLDGSNLADTPLRYVPRHVRRTRDQRHASVIFGDAGGRGMAAYANTGMDIFNRSAVPVAFFDVADPQPMLAAIDQARG
jgi:hypothetical protein